MFVYQRVLVAFGGFLTDSALPVEKYTSTDQIVQQVLSDLTRFDEVYDEV